MHSIVSELAIANESRGRASVVILADKDKVEMEDELHAAVADLGKTKVICRTGDPKNLGDLQLGSPQWARSIILLAPEDTEDPDAEVIKVALALTNGPSRARGEVPHRRRAERSRQPRGGTPGRQGRGALGARPGGDRTDHRAELPQSGLSVVYQEFLDFDGDEIYFTTQPSLVGKTYFDAQLAFPKCARDRPAHRRGADPTRPRRP